MWLSKVKNTCKDTSIMYLVLEIFNGNLTMPPIQAFIQSSPINNWVSYTYDDNLVSLLLIVQIRIK